MVNQDAPPAADSDLKKTLERQIVLGTWGRIHNLGVRIEKNRIVVTGRTPSHYIKQLALQSVFDVVGRTETTEVQCDITVGSGDPVKLQGTDDLWGVPIA